MSDIIEKVWDRAGAAQRQLLDMGIPINHHKLYVAQNIWDALRKEADERLGSPAPFEINRLGGIDILIDRGLSDDQIRLRHEVIA